MAIVRNPDRVDSGPEAHGRRLVPAIVSVVGAATWVCLQNRESLWFDEAMSVGAGNEWVATARQSGGAMSAYYAILRLWTVVSDHPVWIRLLSGLSGVGAAALLSLLVSRVAGRRAGLIAGLTLFCLPTWLAASREARSYACTLLLVVVSWWLLDRIASSPADRTWASWLFTLVWLVLPWFHLAAAACAVSQGVLLVLARAPGAVLRRCSVGLAAAVVGAGLGWRSGAAQSVSWIRLSGLEGLDQYRIELLNPLPTLASALVGLAGLGAWASLHDGDRTTFEGRLRRLAPVLWAALPIAGLSAASAVSPVMLPRYAITALPGIAWLVGLGVDVVASGRLMPRARPRLVLPLVAAFLSLAGVVSLVAVRGDPRTHDWSSVVRLIRADAAPDDRIVFPEPRARVPFEAEWLRQGADPVGRPPGRPLGRVRFSDAVVDDPPPVPDLGGEERVWLVFQRHTPDSVPTFDSTLRAATTADRLAVAKFVTVGSITLVLLEPRRPRSDTRAPS